MAELEEAVKFHGHLCPMFYLGVRMGEFALEKLDREREKGVKLHAVLEFANCFGDGVQVVTGATFGKNNLHLRDTGKFAATFHDLVTGESLRLKVGNDLVERILEYGKAGKKVKALPTNEREAEARRLMSWGREIVDELKNLSNAEIFEITSTEEFVPVEGPSLDHVFCSGCGELTLVDYVTSDKGTSLCQSCLKK